VYQVPETLDNVQNCTIKNKKNDAEFFQEVIMNVSVVLSASGSPYYTFTADGIVGMAQCEEYKNGLVLREELYKLNQMNIDYLRSFFERLSCKISKKRVNPLDNRAMNEFCRVHHRFQRHQHNRPITYYYNFDGWQKNWKILAGFFSNKNGSKSIRDTDTGDPAAWLYIFKNFEYIHQRFVTLAHDLIEFRNDNYAHLKTLRVENRCHRRFMRSRNYWMAAINPHV